MSNDTGAKILLTELFTNLIKDEYRAGFNDTVLSRANDVLREDGWEFEAVEMWREICCGDRKYFAKKYGDSVQSLYDAAVEESKKEGAFVMPEWGTRGT